jgi:hypothetical protein
VWFEGPKDGWQFRDPFCLKLFESLEDPMLQSLQDNAIGPLDQPIGLQVCNRSPIHVDIIVITEFEKLLPCELSVVVGDDGVRDPEAINDVGEERNGFLETDFYYGSGFDLLGELVDSHE